MAVSSLLMVDAVSLAMMFNPLRTAKDTQRRPTGLLLLQVPCVGADPIGDNRHQDQAGQRLQIDSVQTIPQKTWAEA